LHRVSSITERIIHMSPSESWILLRSGFFSIVFDYRINAAFICLSSMFSNALLSWRMRCKKDFVGLFWNPTYSRFSFVWNHHVLRASHWSVLILLLRERGIHSRTNHIFILSKWHCVIQLLLSCSPLCLLLWSSWRLTSIHLWPFFNSYSS
jgi:hypothetical protein